MSSSSSLSVLHSTPFRAILLPSIAFHAGSRSGQAEQSRTPGAGHLEQEGGEDSNAETVEVRGLECSAVSTDEAPGVGGVDDVAPPEDLKHPLVLEH